MGVDTVNWRDATECRTEWVHPPARSHTSRYDLSKAIHIVRAMESSSMRGAVFTEITGKNRLYGLIDRIYAKAGAAVLQPLLLWAYMIKCVLLPGPIHADRYDAVSIVSFDNERHAIDRLECLVPDVRILHLSLKRRHFIGRGQGRALVGMIGAVFRVWPFLTLLASKYSLMPAARIASALAFYIRFNQLFEQRQDIAAAIVASNYSPEAVGMAAAAHRHGRHVVYTNHASVPANGTFVPPVLADCAVVYGEAVRHTYEQRSRCTAEVAQIGQPWTSRPMDWRAEIRKVGIFLTALTVTEEVSKLVRAIRADRPDVNILIRNHPVALLKCDFSDLADNDDMVRITIGNSLDDEIAACDLIFSGNSGVAMNALSGGRPVAYMASLDRLPFDYIGFVASGLICNVEGWSPDLYATLQHYYDRPSWRDVMRSYDASYGNDVEMLRTTAAAIVSPYLRRTQGRN